MEYRATYKYVAWQPSPLKGFKLSPAEAETDLARRYFTWIGPAELAGFLTFAGLGVKAAQAAIAPFKLEPMEAGSERLMFPEDRAKFASFKPPKEAQYTLVSSLDGISLLRRDLSGLMDSPDLAREFFIEKNSRPAGTLEDLPSHAILDRGRLVGLWEFDSLTGTIAWWPFVKKNKDLGKAVGTNGAVCSRAVGGRAVVQFG